ncbi:zinc finger MYM-type protein 1-like [Dendropsophus ebraccatus]|uniref:zinc finger MYM-type protein 1-like n=1 Tax=Dendropsophus ebraccatus TaxID=150705 RepID=UPI0038311995
MSDGRKRLSGAAHKKKPEATIAALAKQKGSMLKFLSSEPQREPSSEDSENVGISGSADPGTSASSSSLAPAELRSSLLPSSEVSHVPLEQSSEDMSAAMSVSNLDVVVLQEEAELQIEGSAAEMETEAQPEASLDFDPLLLQDPGLWMDMSKKLRDFLVLHGPQQVKRFSYPKDDGKRSFDRRHYHRELPNKEVTERQWLVYSVTAICSTGTNDWKNLVRNLATHEKAEYHERAFQKWKELETRLRLNLTIEDQNKEVIEAETQHWRNVLTRLIVLVRTLAIQNLAFRGTANKLFERNNGNFLKFVEAISEFDEIMKKHVRRVTNQETHNHYLGSSIQNEMIQLLAQQVRQKILAQLHLAKYYSVILENTPDISHREQMTLMVRFVRMQEDERNNTALVSIKEHFLCFIEMENTTGALMTNMLIQHLEKLVIDFKDMRGQGYDNGSNMKGKINGVQARVRELNHRAFFVPCSSHSLNLVVSDAASTCIDAVEFFNAIQNIYTFFSASTQRWNILKQNLAASPQSLTLKPLSTTRWESRIDAVKAVRNQISKIDDALTAVAEDPALTGATRSKTIAEARGIQKNLTEYKFLCGLVLWHDILFEINLTSKRLQAVEIDISGAIEQLKKTKLYLQKLRCEAEFENILKAAKKLAEELNVDGDFPTVQPGRKRRRKKLFDYEGEDEQLTDPKEGFKVHFFYEILDCAIQSVEERFSQIREHNNVFGVLYKIAQIKDWTEEELCLHCTTLERVLTHDSQRDIDAADLCHELKSVSRSIPADCATPRSVLEYICKTKTTSIFPNVCIALRILLTLPVTVASGERSFSKLKLIKSYLRSTMTQERLVALATISIEQELAQELNVNDVIATFASQKARRAAFT